jgi:hypothetical protein
MNQASSDKNLLKVEKVEKACHPTRERERELARFRLEICKLKQLKNEHSRLSCSRFSQSSWLQLSEKIIDPVVVDDDDDDDDLAMNLISTTDALDVKGVFSLLCKKEIQLMMIIMMLP